MRRRIEVVMKVLFLDIDGVLNTQKFIVAAQKKTDEKHAKPEEPRSFTLDELAREMEAREKADPAKFAKERWDWHVNMLDPVRIKRLNRIVTETGCVVVLSSSWRIGMDLWELNAMLQSRGAEFSLLSKTPMRETNDECRGDEIWWWIRDWNDDVARKKMSEANVVDRFVIIDDDSDMGMLMANLVKTSFFGEDDEAGLNEAHVEECIRRLNA
jgi:hypothetical protein